MKRWTVEECSWGGGTMKRFWLKRNALLYAERSGYSFVDLKDEVTGKRFRIKDSNERPIMTQPGNYDSIVGWETLDERASTVKVTRITAPSNDRGV